MATSIPCPTACIPENLVANPTASCEVDFRRTTPAVLFFYLCSTPLPDPVTNANMKALWDSGDLVASVKLQNVTFGDPNFEQLQANDWVPPTPIVGTRSMTFTDNQGVVDNSASPTTYNYYADYDFWVDKIRKAPYLQIMIGYCDGSVRIPRQRLTLSGAVSYEKPQNAGGPSLEVKNFTITTVGDMLDMSIKPEWNYIDAGITL